MCQSDDNDNVFAFCFTMQRPMVQHRRGLIRVAKAPAYLTPTTGSDPVFYNFSIFAMTMV